MTRKDYPGVRFLAQGPQVLGSLPGRLAECYGDSPALVIPLGAELRRESFRDLASKARGMAEKLKSMGISPGERVVLMGDNGPEWIMAFFALMSLGAVAVPLDPQLTPEELAQLLAHAEPKAAFVSPRLREAFPASIALIPLALEEFPDHAAIVSSHVSPDDTAALIYTSGTTGNPKGVKLTHRNLWSNALGSAEVLFVKPDDVTLAVLPLHHAYSLTNTLVALACGVPTAFTPSLKPDSILRTLREAKVTVIPAVPLVVDHLARGIQERIAALPERQQRLSKGMMALGRRVRRICGAKAARRVCAPILKPFGPLRGMVVGGAPLNPASAEFFEGLGLTIFHGYGLTETSPIVSFTPSPWRPGDGVGKPLQGVRVRIFEPNAEGIGEIGVQGPNVMAGYFQNPVATEQAFRDGWFKTGDLGKLDARGYLHILGRSKDVIVLPNGKNVYPDELEHHYGRSEAIAELCVLGAHDADLAEYPLGVIVPDQAVLERLLGPGGSMEAVRELLGSEIKRLSLGLADYKRLKRFEVQLEPLPRNHARKVLRHEVRSKETLFARSWPTP